MPIWLRYTSKDEMKAQTARNNNSCASVPPALCSIPLFGPERQFLKLCSEDIQSRARNHQPSPGPSGNPCGALPPALVLVMQLSGKEKRVKSSVRYFFH